jgi:hypothetical protein
VFALLLTVWRAERHAEESSAVEIVFAGANYGAVHTLDSGEGLAGNHTLMADALGECLEQGLLTAHD